MLQSPFKDGLDLKRYPSRKNELLQAWDSADELILQELAEQQAVAPLAGRRILVLNDSFGALSCALEDFDVTVYTDSFVSARAIRLNSQGRIQALNRLQELSGKYDLVLIRIPKNMSYFEDLLCRLSAHLHGGSRVICGIMVKHQAKSAFELLEKYVGVTRTSLARKKARLIFASFERAPAPSPYPLEITLDSLEHSFEHPFTHHSNLFSREKLDIGTRFFLEHIPPGDYPTVLDLGCGNGVIGVAAKKTHPRSRILFSDNSMMAIQSAQANYARYFSDEARFLWLNCFENQEPASVDLVLCNPPFHQGSTVGDFIASQMFKDAHHALRAGGLLRVIGNGHLPYPALLKRIFGNSRIIARSPKFVIVDAIKPATGSRPSA